jgi:hypothetical protein
MCRKMQKSPAVQAGEKLFQRFFAWCSSVGSHMGQQTSTNIRFSWRFTHGGRLLYCLSKGIIARKTPCVDRQQGF